MDISCTKTVRHLSLLSTSLLFFAMGGSAGGAPLFLSANGCGKAARRSLWKWKRP